MNVVSSWTSEPPGRIIPPISGVHQFRASPIIKKSDSTFLPFPRFAPSQISLSPTRSGIVVRWRLRVCKILESVQRAARVTVFTVHNFSPILGEGEMAAVPRLFEVSPIGKCISCGGIYVRSPRHPRFGLSGAGGRDIASTGRVPSWLFDVASFSTRLLLKSPGRLC